MPSNDVMVGITLGVAVLAAVLMWSLGRRAKARPAAADAPAAAPAAPSHDQLLLKFVEDQSGQRRGETVAVEGDRLIVKDADAFLLVPARALRDEGRIVRVVEAVDWDEARREGEAWRTRSHHEISYTPEEIPKDEP